MLSRSSLFYKDKINGGGFIEPPPRLAFRYTKEIKSLSVLFSFL